MDEREQPQGTSGGEPDHGSNVPDEARETALMREVLRTQEQHREGGVEPELGEDSEGPGAEE